MLHVQGDERFKRDGEDVLTEVPISFVKAALGGEVEVHTLDEHCTGSATAEIKPGIQPDEVMVRRGQGIPRVGESGRGDHVLQFKVDIPKKLTPRQEKLMRELATELGETVRPEKRACSIARSSLDGSSSGSCPNRVRARSIRGSRCRSSSSSGARSRSTDLDAGVGQVERGTPVAVYVQGECR